MPKVNRPKLTFKEHKARWADCSACKLCESRKKVVLLRGSVPCQLLFIGEAPGKSEDVLGRPFVGPAGSVLDDIILSSGIPDGTWAMTNLVACIPKGKRDASVVDPPEVAIKACTGRLTEVIDLCRPKHLIAVGELSAKWLPKVLATTKHKKLPITNIIHPAAILRMNISHRGLNLQRAAIAIRDALDSV